MNKEEIKRLEEIEAAFNSATSFAQLDAVGAALRAFIAEMKKKVS